MAQAREGLKRQACGMSRQRRGITRPRSGVRREPSPARERRKGGRFLGSALGSAARAKHRPTSAIHERVKSGSSPRSPGLIAMPGTPAAGIVAETP